MESLDFETQQKTLVKKQKIKMKHFFKYYKSEIISFLLYFLLAVFFTWPVIIKINSIIYGNPGDSLYNLWVFHNLSAHDLIVNAPNGIKDFIHILLPSQPLIDFVSRSLGYLFSNVVTYNLMIILSFPLAGLSVFLIVKLLTKNNWASFLAGLIFAFSPYHLAHAEQHISLVSIYWLGFFTYFLIKSWKENNYQNWGLTGLLFSLTLLDNYQYGFFAIVISATFLSYFAISKLVEKKKIYFNFSALKPIVFSGLIVFTMIFIFDFQLVKSLFSSQGITNLGPARSFRELTVYSAHKFNYLYPSPQNPILGDISREKFDQSIGQTGSNLIEQTLYLGWTTILLALIALLLSMKLKVDGYKLKTYLYFFVLLAFVGAFFSFAPEINFYGLIIKTPANYLFNHFPVIRVYARFGLVVILAMSVAAGIGFALLAKKIKSKYIPILFGSIVLTIFVEFINFPPTNYTDVSKNTMPKVYTYLESQPVGTVAEYPYLPTEEPRSYYYLLWQTYHHFPLLYGAPMNSNDDVKRKELLDLGKDSTIAELKKLNVKYVIIHKNFYTPENIRKYPSEYTDGIIPKINPNYLELLNENSENVLYKIK